MTQLQIGFLIYPGVVQLDVTGAYQVLSFPQNTEVHLIAKTKDPVESSEGMILTPTMAIADCPQLDVICIPGGGLGQLEAMADEETLQFLQQQSHKAQYITSVCTGSMILAAAGLLQGYRAACHWAFVDQLKALGVDAVGDRVVVDRDRITGAGVTSGIDFGLTLLALLCGEPVAKMVQLMMQYEPVPPFDAGTPEKAGQDIIQPLMQLGQPLIDAFWTQTRASADVIQASQ